MHSGDRAAALLKEWPPPKRRELLSSPRLCAPTECCLVEVRVLGGAAAEVLCDAMLSCRQKAWQPPRSCNPADPIPSPIPPCLPTDPASVPACRRFATWPRPPAQQRQSSCWTACAGGCF